MSASDLPELLPCPFCGHVGLDFPLGSAFRCISPTCQGCGASCGEVRIQTYGEGMPDGWMAKAKADALAAWNTRAGDKRAREAVPEGWKLVPVEPTEEMLAAVAPFPEKAVQEAEAAGHPRHRRDMEIATKVDRMGVASQYRQMLASAPTPGENT